jgi:hypothetical protein
MVERTALLREIDALPPEFLGEVADFVECLKRKNLKKIPETMLMSETALLKDWDSPEEDEAWADL